MNDLEFENLEKTQMLYEALKDRGYSESEALALLQASYTKDLCTTIKQAAMGQAIELVMRNKLKEMMD